MERETNREWGAANRRAEETEAGGTNALTPGVDGADARLTMPRAPPARIGAALAASDGIRTPALLVSLPHLEANEQHMRDLLRGSGVALRPHAKAHKSSALTSWQIQVRAAGCGCSKTLERMCSALQSALGRGW